MRLDTRPLLPLVLLAAANAQELPLVDTYWQRGSGVKTFDGLQPFRTPKGMPGFEEQRSQLVDLLRDLIEMMGIVARSKAELIAFDKTGREICNEKSWLDAYERVKATSLTMEGWLGKVLMESDSVLQRRACAYGMFYFNNPQHVIHLISFLPGEPVREIREDGYQRALQFLRVHLPESKPQNPERGDDGGVVPAYEFNPLPFIQLLDTEHAVDRAQGMWFLTEVLHIRPDLGRAYLGEVRSRLPKLLTEESKLVRSRALDFLAAIDRKKRPVPKTSATVEECQAWCAALVRELFPPIRHVSTGRCEIYAGEDLDRLVAAGKRLLSAKGLFPDGSAKVKGGAHRYGVRVGRLPAPLDQLGLPADVLVVAINSAPTRNEDEFHRVIREQIAAEEAKRSAAPKGKQPPVPTFMVEYVNKGEAHMKEFRLLPEE